MKWVLIVQYFWLVAILLIWQSALIPSRSRTCCPYTFKHQKYSKGITCARNDSCVFYSENSDRLSESVPDDFCHIAIDTKLAKRKAESVNRCSKFARDLNFEHTSKLTKSFRLMSYAFDYFSDSSLTGIDLQYIVSKSSPYWKSVEWLMFPLQEDCSVKKCKKRCVVVDFNLTNMSFLQNQSLFMSYDCEVGFQKDQYGQVIKKHN